MIVPAWTEFCLVVGGEEPEWSWGGSDTQPLARSPRAACVVRVYLDGRVEPRATSPSGEPYLAKLLERHPFDASAVRAFVVRVYGRPHAVVQARSKFEAVCNAGLPPEGLEVRAQDEHTADAWAALLRQ